MRTFLPAAFVCSTLMALAAACSSTSTTRGTDAGPDCGVRSPAHNDLRCPASKETAGACPVGLSCTYPGQGDPDQNGCYGTAHLSCCQSVPCQSAVGDAGDGGAQGMWVLTQ